MRFDSGDSGHLPNKVGRVGGRAIFFGLIGIWVVENLLSRFFHFGTWVCFGNISPKNVLF